MNVDLMRRCLEFARNGTGKFETPEGFQEAVWNQDMWCLTGSRFTSKLEQISRDQKIYELTESEQRLLDHQDSDCGTAFCIAGYAAQVSGTAEHLWQVEVGGSLGELGMDWDSAGRTALGITQNEALLLFSATNTLEQVEDAMRDICVNHRVDPKEIGL